MPHSRRFRIILLILLALVLTGTVAAWSIFRVFSASIITECPIEGMAWSADGTQFAFSDDDYFVGITQWKERPWTEGGGIHVQALCDHERDVRNHNRNLWLDTEPPMHWLQWSPDGSAVASRSYYRRGRIHIWSVPLWGAYYPLGRQIDPASTISTSEDGYRNQSWGPENQLLAIKIASLKLVGFAKSNDLPRRDMGAMKVPAERISSGGYFNSDPMKWSPDARKILVGSWKDNSSSLWCYDVEEARDMGTLCTYDVAGGNDPHDIIWSPDSKSVALFYVDSLAPGATAEPGVAYDAVRIELFDVATCRKFQTLRIPLEELAPGKVLTPPPANDILSRLDWHTRHELAWSRDGKRFGGAFLVQQNAGTPPRACAMVWWNVADARILARSTTHSPGTIDLARWAPDLEQIAIAQRVDFQILGYRIPRGRFGMIRRVAAPAMGP